MYTKSKLASATRRAASALVLRPVNIKLKLLEPLVVPFQVRTQRLVYRALPDQRRTQSTLKHAPHHPTGRAVARRSIPEDFLLPVQFRRHSTENPIAPMSSAHVAPMCAPMPTAEAYRHAQWCSPRRHRSPR